MAALETSALGKRKAGNAQSLDVVHVLQCLEKRAQAPKYKFYRRRLPDIWNAAHPTQKYATIEDLTEHEGDACIPFFVQHVIGARLSLETQKSYLNALKQLGRSHFSVECVRTLDDQLKTLRVDIFAHESKNECNDTDDAHWISWESVTKLFDSFTVRMYENSNDEPYDVWQSYLLFALYCLQPPLRNNYSCVFMEPPPFTPDLQDLCSYVNLKGDAPYIHIGHDKVSDVYGSCNIPLDAALVNVITGLEKKFGPRKYLLTLMTSVHLPLEESNLRTQKTNTARLWTRLSEIVGHPLNVCMLRSSYATWLLNQPNLPESEIIKAAGCMRTSTNALRINYRKVKGPPTTPPPSPSLGATLDWSLGPSSLSDF